MLKKTIAVRIDESLLDYLKEATDNPIDYIENIIEENIKIMIELDKEGDDLCD